MNSKSREEGERGRENMMGKLWEQVKRESRAKEDRERVSGGKETEKDDREREEKDERKWATRESPIWRHYKKEGEMLRAKNTEGRV